MLLETTDALYERRAADALRSLDRLSNEGKDLSQFAGELVAHLRRLMLLPDAPEVALAEVGTGERAGLEEQAGRVPTAEVVRMIEALGATISRAKRGGDPKLELELTFLKLARDYEEPPVEALLARLEALEEAVTNGGANAVTAPTPASWQGPSVTKTEVSEPEEAGDEAVALVPEARVPEVGEPEAPEAKSEPEAGDVGRGDPESTAAYLQQRWESVIQDLKDRKKALTAAYLKEGQARPVGFRDGLLTVAFSQEQDFYVKEIDKPQHKEALGEVLEERLGTRPRLEFRVTDGDAGASGVIPDPPSPTAPAARSVPETRAEQAPEPVDEPESPQNRVAETATVPEPEVGGEADGGTSRGDERAIQSQLEVFEIARERFGGPGRE